MFSQLIERLSGFGQRSLGLVRLFFQFITEVLNVSLTLLSDGANIAPWPFSKHAGTQVNQRRPLMFTVVTVRETHARTNGKVSRDGAAILVRQQGVKHCIGDGMLGQNGINLFNSKVDLIQSLPEGFNLPSQALELGSVDHVAQPSELLGVEEARDERVCSQPSR